MNGNLCFIGCATGVVYQIPFAWGHVVVKTGCCINIRLLEHKNSLKHRAFVCKPISVLNMETLCFFMAPLSFRFMAIRSLYREVIEAYIMFEKKGGLCTSEQSIALLEKEFVFGSVNVLVTNVNTCSARCVLI